MAEETTSTLQAFLDREARLITEASLTIPHTFSSCTHPRGHIRQNVYLCKTCAIPRGICAACSVACHTDHEQVELFAKRDFRCDCPTDAIPHDCKLVQELKETNTRNQYNQNFQNGGSFCRCGRDYDAKTERETMVQCLVCEDWYHESCLNLRDRPPPIQMDAFSGSQPPSSQPSSSQPDISSDIETDSVTDPTLPAALIPGATYDCLICRDCVLRIPLLLKYAGTPGVMMAVREDDAGDLKVIGREISETAVVVDELDDSTTGEKRKLETNGHNIQDGPAGKRSRLDNGEASKSAVCLAPPPNPAAQQVFEKLRAQNHVGANDLEPSTDSTEDLGAGDIFLTEDFRDRWCRCPECSKDLEKYACLRHEEPVYEPPEDPDSALSFEELGLRALNHLPRERAIDGIVAYNKLRDELKEYLRPFARDGTAVSEEDIKGFFSMKAEEMRTGRAPG